MDWVAYAKWAVVICVVLGVAGVGVAVIVAIRENTRLESVRASWDEVDSALKEKSKPADRIAAYEAVAPKVNGTTAHAFVLMQLGGLYLDNALKPEYKRPERDAALKRATQLYQRVIEEYKNNPAFGPLAISNLALAYEQAEDFDNAIKTMKDSLGPEMQSHFLYDKMTEQLGRLYWLRSLKETAAGQEAKAREDRDAAWDKLHIILLKASSKDDAASQTQWREEAKYLKSLLDKPGALLPDGKIPPPKVEPKEAVAAPPAKSGEPSSKAPAEAKAPPAPASPPAEKAEKKEEKKDSPPATEQKTEPKKDEKAPAPAGEGKKEGSMNESRDSQPLAETGAPPAQHLSYGQMVQMLKQGKTSFCQCPRCLNAAKSFEAKLAE